MDKAEKKVEFPSDEFDIGPCQVRRMVAGDGCGEQPNLEHEQDTLKACRNIRLIRKPNSLSGQAHRHDM
jgi:hypothetical protein